MLYVISRPDNTDIEAVVTDTMERAIARYVHKRWGADAQRHILHVQDGEAHNGENYRVIEALLHPIGVLATGTPITSKKE